MLGASGIGGPNGQDADVEDALADGRAMDAWREMIRAQDGDPDAELPAAAHTHDVVASSDGVLAETDALAFGVASWRLGAGRARKGDPVQAGAGVELHAVKGEKVSAGQKLFTLHTDTPERFERALEVLETGYSVEAGGTGADTAQRSVILDRIG